MTAKRKAIPATPEPIRAFEIIDNVKPGHTLFQQDDDYHHPHLRAGEFAVVDLSDREFQNGELYLVEWNEQSRGLYQVTQRALGGSNQGDGIWFGPLCKMKTLPDGSLDRNQTWHMSEGPLEPKHLPKYLRGRVVGVLAGTQIAMEKGVPQPPVPLTLPRVRPDDEMRWRYLAWLTYERDQLAHELGARTPKGIFTLEDGAVHAFMQPWFAGMSNREWASYRAERVLAAAGVSLEPDPDWVGLPSDGRDAA
jgi:hypothetical protein